MNQKKILILTFSLLSLVWLYAENQMDLIWTQTGEHRDSYYGSGLAAIDFNGDGIDDLIVGSHSWDPEYEPPNSSSWGKLYFHLGGVTFSNEADFTMQGSEPMQGLGQLVVNLGDMNGDDFDDFGIIRTDNDNDILYCIQIFYCGTVFDTIPDFEYTLSPLETATGAMTIRPLGDVNGDGLADAGFSLMGVGENNPLNIFYIIYGNEVEPVVEYWATLGVWDYATFGSYAIIDGIGDINNDGYDDIEVGYFDDEIEDLRNDVFFGGNPPDTLADFSIISENPPVWWEKVGGTHCGDYNGDGLDDFIGKFGSPPEGRDIWFGGEELTEEPDVILLPGFMGGLVRRNFAFGDLNNDGISDIVLGNENAFGADGAVYIYVGSTDANDSVDLTIPGINYEEGFGSRVALGDFNNDGCDDLAVGAPYTHSLYSGDVYVFAGNEELEETTPAGINDNQIPIINEIEFNAYPNPFNPIVIFEIKFSNKQNEQIQIEIFNIKGQKVDELAITEGDNAYCRILWNAEGKPSGVYLCKLVNVETEKILSVKKVTLLK